MIYAISTHSFFIIVELDSNLELSDFKVIDKGYHYGMAYLKNPLGDDDPLLAVYRGGDSLFKQDNREFVLYATRKPYNVYDRIPITGEIGDVHQVVYANGGIYLTNTAYNSIVFYDLKEGIRHEYSFERQDVDLNHVNSVFPGENQLLVMLHNRTRKESQIAVMNHDPEKGFKLIEKLSLWHIACHNIFYDNGFLYYNASPGHCTVKVDVKRNSIQQHLSFIGHIKGLSVTDKHIAVGISEDTYRDKRFNSRGQLAMIDRESFSVLKIIDLKSPEFPPQIGNINEIRCLSHPEFAHRPIRDFDVDWSKLKLAKSEAVKFYLRHMRTRFLWPFRHGRKQVRQMLKLNQD